MNALDGTHNVVLSNFEIGILLIELKELVLRSEEEIEREVYKKLHNKIASQTNRSVLK